MIDIINRPYAEALADVNLEGDNIVDVAKFIKNRLAKYKDIQISLSLEELARLSPKVSASLSQIFSRTESALPILVASTVNLFNTGTECTYIHITVNHKKVIAILDTGAPENIVSTKLMNSIKLAPDVDYKKSFGTAGPNVTWAVGAYSALTLRFGKTILQSPAIVLNNNNYDILIGTSFMRRWNCKIILGKNLFFINGEEIPIFYSRKVPIVSPKNVHWINVKYPKGTFPLKC